MSIENMTIGDLLALQKMFFGNTAEMQKIDNKMVGKYVLVRCRDAGVHTGVLESYNGRECVLTESRRLWYWKPANGQKYLSGVAFAGLHEASKVGVELPRIHLTETCELIECSHQAEKSIREAKIDE